MARVPCEIRVGTGRNARAITTENRYLLGPAEGTWWTKYSWWVIPLGLLVLILPWIFLFGGGGGSNAQTSVVIQQVAPPSVPTPPATPAELTPEELDRRHSEVLRRRDQ